MPPSSLLPHRWPGPPLAARLIARPNRFLALCALPGPRGDRTVEAHVPDRGRALDLMIPGQPVILVAAPTAPGAPPRRTSFTLVLARAKSAPSPWVCMDPAGAPRLLEAALELGLLPSLRGLRVVQREVAHGRSRIDLLLAPSPAGKSNTLPEGIGQVLCEVKSVGAARDGLALFPDAPTERGARHLAELARLQRKCSREGRGWSAAVVLVAQRGDVRAIAPDREIDPAFAAALARARRAGVLVAGLLCAAYPEGMEVLREVGVLE